MLLKLKAEAIEESVSEFGLDDSCHRPTSHKGYQASTINQTSRHVAQGTQIITPMRKATSRLQRRVNMLEGVLCKGD